MNGYKNKTMYKIKIFWGSDNVLWANHQPKSMLDMEPENDSDITIKVFNSKELLDVYIQGIEDGNGWSDYYVHEMK